MCAWRSLKSARRFATGAAPSLLNPYRLMMAFSSGSLKTRGFALPRSPEQIRRLSSL